MKKADTLNYTKKAAQAADDKLGQEIVVLDVSKDTTLADYFVFITGTSHVHVRALEDAIREALKTSGASLSRTDGQRGHVWRVLDYGNLMVHIMDQKTRDFYSIEKLWEKGKPVAWSSKPAAKAKARPSKVKAVRPKAARAKPVRKKAAARRGPKKK